MPLSQTRDKLRQLAVGPQNFRNDVYDALVRQFGEDAEIVNEIRRLNEEMTSNRQTTLQHHDRFNVFPLGWSLAQSVLSVNAQDTAHLPMLSISNDSCQLSFQLGGGDAEKQNIPLVATFHKWDAANTDDGENSTWWKFVHLKVNGLGADVNLMSSRHIAFTYSGQIGSAAELKVVAGDTEFMNNIQQWVQENTGWEYSQHKNSGTSAPIYGHVQKRSNGAQKRTVDEALIKDIKQKRQRREAIMVALKQAMQANV